MLSLEPSGLQMHYTKDVFLRKYGHIAYVPTNSFIQLGSLPIAWRIPTRMNIWEGVLGIQERRRLASRIHARGTDEQMRKFRPNENNTVCMKFRKSRWVQ